MKDELLITLRLVYNRTKNVERDVLRFRNNFRNVQDLELKWHVVVDVVVVVAVDLQLGGQIDGRVHAGGMPQAHTDEVTYQSQDWATKPFALKSFYKRTR